MTENFQISNFTKGKINLPFEIIKNKILGKGYNLSLVFVGERRSKKINLKYREKNKSANVLSFPLSENEGEIFITPKRAFRQAHLFEMKKIDFIGFLFIHGLLHLKGMQHGSRMEEAEKKFFVQFFKKDSK